MCMRVMRMRGQGTCRCSPENLGVSPAQQRHPYQYTSDLVLLCHLFGKVKIVSEPLPHEDLLNGQAGVAVSQGEEEVPSSGGKGNNGKASHPGTDHALACVPLASSDVLLGTATLLAVTVNNIFIAAFGVEDELQKSTGHQTRGHMSR